MARIGNKKKAKSRFPAKQTPSNATILVVEFDALPSGIRALLLSDKGDDQNAIRHAKRRLKIPGAGSIVLRLETHAKICEKLHIELLEKLPAFAFGSIDFLVRASVQRIESEFLRLVSEDKRHFEYSIRNLRAQKQNAEKQAANLLSENEALKKRIAELEKDLATKQNQLAEGVEEATELKERIQVLKDRVSQAEWAVSDVQRYRWQEQDALGSWRNKDPSKW